MYRHQHVPVVLVHLLEPLEDAELLRLVVVASVGERAGLPQTVTGRRREGPLGAARHVYN